MVLDRAQKRVLLNADVKREEKKMKKQKERIDRHAPVVLESIETFQKRICRQLVGMYRKSVGPDEDQINISSNSRRRPDHIF